MTIPLYIRPFESISKVFESEELTLNEELLWILKEGFTITSIGLHSEINLEN